MGLYQAQYTTAQIDEMLDAAYEGVINLPWAEYSAAVSYKPLNKVVYQGQSYMCKLACTGIAPTNTGYWLLIAKKGADGNTSVSVITGYEKGSAVPLSPTDTVNQALGKIEGQIDGNATDITELEGTVSTELGKLELAVSDGIENAIVSSVTVSPDPPNAGLWLEVI